MISDDIRTSYAVYSYDSFIPRDDDPFPSNRITDFMVTGPFVLETDGAFETEHLYDRYKLLDEDYLASDGGERNVIPQLGKKVKNRYFGAEYLVWEKGFIKWNALRFDREEDACDPALYATNQRNAVYYAAFYLDCEKDETAVICYENSGSSLFVNGEQVDYQPFGRVKGLWGLGHQKLVHFVKGKNLIMFKLRPGYIADTMDISMSACSVFPCMAVSGGVYLTSPTVTLAYGGTAEAPRQIFPVFVSAERNCDKAEIVCCGEAYEVSGLKAGQTVPVRLAVPSDKETATVREIVSLTADANESAHAEMYFVTTPYDGYKGREFVFSDFHFDTTYHQEQRTYALGAFHITKSIIERLEENPDFKATLSELDYLHPYYTLYPHHRKALKKAFAEGRAEADCFYNQPNDLTSSGEAFVRNLVYGQLYHRDVMGRISTVYAPGDVFGHFSQITQVCAKGGCNYIKWGKMMLGVDSLFRHVSPDGTSLLHDKGFGRKDAARLGVTGCGASSEGVSYMEAFPREGNTEWMKQTVSKARFAVFSELASEVVKSAETSGKKIEYTSRDITQHHSGVLLTRTDFKQANRLCENLLVTAEKFASIAFLYGADYPETALDKAWRQLLCAQHHDSVTGTNNEISFADLMIQYRECAQLAADTLTKAAHFIASGVKTADRDSAIFVFNPCAWERGGRCDFTLPDKFSGRYAVVKDIKGKEYPVEINGRKASFTAPQIPATGYSLFRLEEITEDPDPVIRGTDNVIENNRFRLIVAPERGGCIASLYDKAEKKELIDLSRGTGANMLYVLKELHDRMETQHEIYTTGQKLMSVDYPAEIASEKCRAYQKLTVSVKLDVIARAVQEITLYKNSTKIDFRTVIEDYNGEDDMFCVTFPLDIKGAAVMFDDRFAPHVSTRSKKYMSFQTHQYASFSGCRILPANQWFGIGPSVKVKPGIAGGFNIGMTAIITDGGLEPEADRLLFALTKKGVPVTVYPDGEQHGGNKIIHFGEDIYETDTRFVLSFADSTGDYAGKLLDTLSAPQKAKLEKLLAAWGYAAVYFTDSDNAYGKPVNVLLMLCGSSADMATAVTEIESALKSSYTVSLPNAVTGSIPAPAEDYGAAILNNGNIACSVEGSSTLNLMLFHTASFYGNKGKVTGDKELVPERKTHSFTYALYPHKGSFREADVYRRAFEFNDSLFAISDTKNGENAFLPEEKGFLKTGGSFAVTAFKAGGYPYASLKNEKDGIEKRGLVVRGFETDGTGGKITVKTGFDIFGAQNTDLLEEHPKPLKTSRNSFSFICPPHSVETCAVVPAPVSAVGKDGGYTVKEAVSPVYVRSWEHDLGSMPAGFLKFAATINKRPEKLSGTETRLYICAVNNSTDSPADAVIDIACSDGITADKNRVSVSLEKEEAENIPFTVTLTSPDVKGQVKIYYEYAGMTFTDVYEFGSFDPEVSLEIEGSSLICTVKNPSAQTLDATLHIASPFETWGDGICNRNTIGSVSPAQYSVCLAPFETKTYEFTADMPDEGFFKAYWAAVKLCCNGRIHFAFAEKHGPRHNYWAHEFINEIYNDNGSIKKLIEM